MRKVTFGVGNSLDNYIARSNHDVDWLSWNNEVASISAEFWKTIDTVVMGRKTYEVGQRWYYLIPRREELRLLTHNEEESSQGCRDYLR
ncbi:MAG: hypothetical protein HYY49_05075 [Ignavibacteriales bacterium]|nr:hypothetical protein [Ignavibacteriales bacterium]